jgi:ABC-type branched-subunit amino acid transport system substrate-binding protein
LIVGPQTTAEIRRIKGYADANKILLVSQSSTAPDLAIPDDYDSHPHLHSQTTRRHRWDTALHRISQAMGVSSPGRRGRALRIPSPNTSCIF